MKKILRFIGITLVIIILALVALPYVFHNQITHLVKTEGNKMIKGEFDFNKLQISFFKQFPQVSIAMNGFWLRGEKEFAQDTLAQIGELSLTVDLSSFFSKQYKVNAITLNDAKFKAVVNKSGVPNWDIMVNDSTDTKSDKGTTTIPEKEAATFNIALQRILVNNLSVMYKDIQAGSSQTYKDINMDLSVTLQNDHYALHNSHFAMGDLGANIDGWLAFISEKEMDFDLKLDTEKATVKIEGMPQVQVAATTLKATPTLITLQPTKIKIGDSDMTIDCTIHNLIKYLNQNGVLKGEMNLNSTRLNLNQFISGSEPQKTSEEEKKGEASKDMMQVLEVPKRIDFKINANCQKILFQDIIMESLKGQLVAKNCTLAMKGLAFNTMMGSAQMDGMYSTKDKNTPQIAANLQLKDISFLEAYKQSGIIKKMAPIFEHTEGSFSSDMSIDLNFDKHMQPVMNSVNGKGYIEAKELQIKKINVLTKIAEVTKKPELAQLSPKNLKVNFTIDHGVVTTQPFDIEHAEYKMTMSGKTSLDQKIDYNAIIQLPKGTKIAGLNEVGLKIEGTFEKPKVKIDTKKAVNELLNNLLKNKSKNKDDKDKSDIEKGVDLLKGLF